MSDGGRHGSEIAVLGMSGRFPGARPLAAGGSTLDAFWRNLRDGVESISFFSEDQLAAAGVDPALARDPRYVPAQATVDGVELFDAAFFDMSPREAELTDPQHRFFLECAWEAVARAGYDPRRCPGPVGVFAGARTNVYALSRLVESATSELDAFLAAVGNDRDHLTTRVSYKLGLTGPSVNVQTACSTSLVAVHLACQSLNAGDCDLALAGGVAIALPQGVGYLHEEGSILSGDGHCRPFDAAASGTVNGNGAGVVVLKRLDEATADGDPVLAVILGSAINNDGADKVGYSAPGVSGQAAVVEEALAVAGVAADTVAYVEGHGTATPLGDPVEVAALTQAFRATTGKRGFCALGSVKSNVGHLDAAAGVAGLIKAVLALRHREIPPTLHFTRPNPEIDFAASPFFVPTELVAWPEGEAPRRAGVSSFGIGGTNAHVVLEEAPPRGGPAPARRRHLLAFSARNTAALEATARNLARDLARRDAAELADVAFTLQAGRACFEHRRVLVASDPREASAALGEGRGTTRFRKPGRPKVAFLFPGLGGHAPGTGRGLYDEEPVFRDEVDRVCGYLEPELGLDLRPVLYPAAGQEEDAARRRRRNEVSHPAFFVLQVALGRLWRSWGIEPRALLGHSLGEYAAACLAGVFRTRDAAVLVARRGRALDAAPPGAMLAVAAAPEDLASRLGPELEVAAVNAPRQSVIAGTVAAVNGLARRLAEDGVHHRHLELDRAFHSSAVAAAAERFAEEVARCELRPPEVPFLSSVTGDWIAPEEATDPAYWGRHARATVRFSDALARLLREQPVLLEVGPGQGLLDLARQQPAAGEAEDLLSSLPGLRECREDGDWILETLGRLWLCGAPVEPAAGTAGERRRVELPTYPFERRRYWIEPTVGHGTVPRTAAPAEETPTREEPGPEPPGKSFVAPAGAAEEAVAEIWREVLGVARIGADDDFFELGGDSLRATLVLSRLRRRHAAEVTLAQFFAARSVAALARFLEGREEGPGETTPADVEEGRI